MSRPAPGLRALRKAPRVAIASAPMRAWRNVAPRYTKALSGVGLPRNPTATLNEWSRYVGNRTTIAHVFSCQMPATTEAIHVKATESCRETVAQIAGPVVEQARRGTGRRLGMLLAPVSFPPGALDDAPDTPRRVLGRSILADGWQMHLSDMVDILASPRASGIL